MTRDQWLPIETAPKDGTRILVWDNGLFEQEVLIGFWKGDWVIPYTNMPDGEYITVTKATHWMPVPEPPAFK